MNLSKLKGSYKKYWKLNNDEINNLIKLLKEIDTDIKCDISEELNNWLDSYKRRNGTEFKISFDIIVNYIKRLSNGE
jgi:spore coat protein CotH